MVVGLCFGLLGKMSLIWSRAAASCSGQVRCKLSEAGSQHKDYPDSHPVCRPLNILSPGNLCSPLGMETSGVKLPSPAPHIVQAVTFSALDDLLNFVFNCRYVVACLPAGDLISSLCLQWTGL